MITRTKIFLGTELKLNINIEPIGELTMDDYDWSVEAYCSTRNTVVIKKKDAIRMDSDNYVILVDSAIIGSGDIKCRITAYIPDGDFHDGLRTEIVGIDTGITIVKSI